MNPFLLTVADFAALVLNLQYKGYIRVAVLVLNIFKIFFEFILFEGVISVERCTLLLDL